MPSFGVSEPCKLRGDFCQRLHHPGLQSAQRASASSQRLRLSRTPGCLLTASRTTHGTWDARWGPGLREHRRSQTRSVGVGEAPQRGSTAAGRPWPPALRRGGTRAPWSRKMGAAPPSPNYTPAGGSFYSPRPVTDSGPALDPALCFLAGSLRESASL